MNALPHVTRSRTSPTGRGAQSLQRAFQIPVAGERPIEFIESFVDPVTLIGSLWALALYFEVELSNAYLILGLVVFSMTFPGPSYLRASPMRVIWRVASGWLIMAGLLGVFGYAAHLLKYFDAYVLVNWLWLGPTAQLLGRFTLRGIAPTLITVSGGVRRAVIVGVNDQGLSLTGRVTNNNYAGIKVVGYFDDRRAERLPEYGPLPLLGSLAELPAFVQSNDIHVIYLSLPMTTQERIIKLLDELRDTTASIYFVPDFFVTDLIQGRMDTVEDIPVVAVCESPFNGLSGLVKRASDLVLASLILVLLTPLLLLIALGVKLGSPGPVIFRQRRYGLDGKEIIVYKFRSMTVCEDGGDIRQAQKGDSRLTPFGAFLRKSSLDELPQLVNVLQGRMSIVGPRPHAVAHNEMYRKLIKGYMVRHKVRPGMTGWAQVNGLRGETDTLDKMQARIEHDLEYLRNWSPRLDLYIIFKTVFVVLRDQHAY
jgi:putative colanic acid biosynthesis UDP-glucose lipid carrier transferase